MDKKFVIVLDFPVRTPTRTYEDLCVSIDLLRESIDNSKKLSNRYEVLTLDDSFDISPITIERVKSADIWISDLSGEKPSPSVMYNLAVRLSGTEKPAILIREDNIHNQHIFDIQGFYIFSYKPTRYKALFEYIEDRLRRYELGEEYVSPVKRHLEDYGMAHRSEDNLQKQTASKDAVDITKHNFEVALSFPGEVREYVHAVAESVESICGSNACFYDNNYKSQLARPSLDILLQDIYRNRSKLVVVFIGTKYQEKKWCGIEFRAVKEIIMDRELERVMLVKMDEGTVEGIFDTDGYIDAQHHSPEEVANFISERVSLMQ